MKDLQNIFDFFRGNWEFDRQITGEQQGIAIGRALFAQNELNQLDYCEEGILSLPESKTNFTRHYTYKQQAEHIDVFYADGPDSGKLYQSYSLNESQMYALQNHFCGEDVYEGLYNLIDDNQFTLTTRVKGPKKNYVMTTEFRRIL